MSLDPVTIISITIISSLLMGISLLVVSRGYLGQIQGITKWAFATLLQCLGWITLAALRGLIPDIISIVLGNALILLSLAMYFNILAAFKNYTISSFWSYSLVGLEMAALSYFVLITPDVSKRIVIISVFGALIMFASSYILFSKRDKQVSSDSFAGWLFAGCAVIITIRCINSLFWDTDPNQAPFGPHPVQGFSYITFYLMSVFLTFSFILMCAEKYINGRKLIEDALKESEAKFSLLAKNATDIISLHDLNLNYIYVSDSVKRTLGYEPSDLIGKPASDFIHPEDYLYVKNRYTAMHNRNSIEYTLFRHKRKDGSYCWVESSANFTFDEGGNITGLVVNTRDISERKKSEELLIKNEKQLNDAQELAKIGSWELTLPDMELTWSKEHYRIFELEKTPPDKLYNAYRIKIHPDDIPRLDAVMKNALETGHGFNYEHRVICNNKDIKYVLGIGQTIKDTYGKTIGIKGTVQDITQRKKDEDILLQSELRYRTLAEASEDMVFIISPKGTIDYLNDFAARELGHSSEFLAGKQMTELFPSTDSQRQWESLKQIFQNGQSDYIENQTKLGSHLKWLGTNLVPLRDLDGNITSVMGVARDITERINSENVLKENEAFIANILENIPSMIFVKDAEELRFIRINKAGEKLTGISREEIINKNDYDFFPKSEADFFTKKDREVLKSDSVIDIPEETIQTKFHGQRILHTQKISILDTNGKPKYLLGISQDITEKKQAEQELIFAKEQAERLANSKEEFLSNMSHEIRTPLNGIIGFTKLLLENDYPEKQKEQLEAIKISSNILMVLINDILDLSKMEAGQMTVEQTEFNLTELINGLHDTFKLQFKEKGLRIFLQFDKNIPKILIGDPVRIYQILMNLISNAKKFSNYGGEININISELNEAPLDFKNNDEKINIKFNISDTGIGIPEEKLETIFEPFIQANKDTTRKYGGTGLGLSIVKKLVGLMNGTIHVQSKLNEGSTFTVILPLKLSSADEITAPDEIGLNTEELKQLGPLKILLAEDNDINQLLAQTILKQFGFEVDTADNGKIAIDFLEKNNYDLILMDLRMPIMDGIEATQHIRSKMAEPKASIPIIVITADTSNADLEKYTKAGMNDFVYKPFNQADLLNKIISSVKKNKNIKALS